VEQMQAAAIQQTRLSEAIT